MKLIKISSIIFIFALFFTPLFGEITNIQYEGTWDRSSWYSYGLDIKNDTLYVGAWTAVERYHIEEDGDLEFIDYMEFSGFVGDLHIAGDSLYVATIGDADDDRIRIVDISNGDMEIVFDYPIVQLLKMDDGIYSNNRYVLFCSWWQSGPDYYYDRREHTMSQITFPIYESAALIGNYFFDFQWNTGELRIRDISDIDNPETVYVGEPISAGPPWAYISVLNDTTIIFTDSPSSNNPSGTVTLLDISDITNPEVISSIPMETTETCNPAIPVGYNNYLLLTTWSSGERFLYNIEDIENPYLECSWLIAEHAHKSIAYENYFYTMCGGAGIAKYDTNLLPITEPLAYFGNTMHYSIWCDFDGQRVIIYRRDKIITKETPDDEGTIIYQDPAIDYYNGFFTCSDSLTIVQIFDLSKSTMDLKIIETATGEILNSIDNFPYYQHIVYIEPYFYFYTYNANFAAVYRVSPPDWDLDFVASIQPPYPNKITWLDDCPGNYLWVTTQNMIYIYDTDTFEEVSSFPYSAFIPDWAADPFPKFFNGLLYISYGDEDDFCRYGRLYSFDLINDPILIDEADFGEYTVLYLVEDTMISARNDKPSLLYLFSEDGFPEPYDEYFFNGRVTQFEMDEANDRIFVRKQGSYDSFTYDYVHGIGDSPQPADGIQLSNFPNPFSTSTTISFSIPPHYTDEAEIEIYNIKGQRVKQFRIESASWQTKLKINKVVWDGKDAYGKPLPSGIYFAKLSLGEESAVKKMLLLR